jgi:putative aldouronate transport system substrate-binding protein
MKKVLLTLLLAALATALFVGCGNDDNGSGTRSSATPAEALDSWLVPERTTITLAASLAPNWGHPTEGSFWEWLEEYTNVEVNWITFLAAEAPEQFALMMASRDLPDAFIGGLGGGTANILEYGVQLGVYIPLNDLLANYAPNFMRRAPLAMPDIMSIITAPDGNIYSLPVIHAPGTRVYNTTAINQTWLDNLGLAVPTTIEEVEQVLIAFRDGDPNGSGQNDEIPLSFMFNCWGAADHSWWFAPFGAPLSNDLVLIENNRVTFQGAQDYFRDAARWLSSLYAQNLIDLEIFTYDETSYRARAGADPVVFGIWSSWNPSQDSGANGEHFTTFLPPIQGPGGAHVLWNETTGITRDVFQITSAASDLVLLTRWVDIFYRDVETGLRATQGPGPDENQAWFFDENDMFQWVTPRPDAYIRGMNELPFAPAIVGTEFANRAAPPLTPNLKVDHIENVLTPYAANFFNGTWNRWPLTFMLADEADELSFIEADLIPFTQRMLARWIAGEGDVDAEWDQYLRDLDAYGLQRWLEIRQGVWDRFRG